MPSSTELASIHETAFTTAKAKFRELQADSQMILNLWRQALPRYQNEISEFLATELTTDLSVFAGNENNNYLNNAVPAAPWTVLDMNAYYNARNDSNKIKTILRERRIIIISEKSFTRFDNYQLIRDEHAPNIIAKRKIYYDNLEHLALIHQSLALLENREDAVQNHVSQIVELLNYLKLQLTAVPAEDAEPMSGTDKENLICKIDACCEYIAAYFLEIITNLNVDENSNFIKLLLHNLDQLDNEIFPWLSLTFQNDLPFNEEEAIELTNEFFKFHCLRHGKSLAELITNLIGGTATILQTNELLFTRKAWYSLSKKSFREQLALISKYICQSEVSDWMMLNMAMSIVYHSPHVDLEPMEVVMIARFFNRIRGNSFLLPQANIYLQHVAKDIANKLDTVEDSAKDLSVTIESGNKAVIKARARSLNHYPPLAEIFYDEVIVEENLDDEKPDNLQAEILTTVMNYEAKDAHAYLAAVFSDDNYWDQHQKFFQSNIPNKLGLRAIDFPLLALRLHYTQQQVVDDVISLWEAFIDQDSVTETDFFNHETNSNLFSHIYTIKDQLITAEKISQHPQRYKKLLLALEIYRSMGVGIMDLSPLLGFIVSYPERRRWTLNCINFIVKCVAYPLGSRRMNFQNVNNFLGLALGRPTALQANTQAMFDFAVEHPNHNFNFDNALVLMFMKLFRKKENDLSDAQIYQSKSISLEKLPAQCQTWLDLDLIKNYILFPVFADTLFIHSLESMYSTDLAKRIFSMSAYATAMGFAASMRRFGEAQFEEQTDLVNNLMSGLGLNLNFETQIRFTQELYYAYCLNKKSLNAPDVDSAYMDLYSINVTDNYLKAQVAAFIKIYSALRVAQSGFFKTNWVAQHNIAQLPPVEALELIKEHAGKSASRSQKAWELAKKYDFEVDPENILLIQKIYSYGFSHSGLFKRSTSFKEAFYRADSLNQKLDSMDAEEFQTCIRENDSRLYKTVRALR